MFTSKYKQQSMSSSPFNNSGARSPGSRHGKKASAVLSMPNLFRATELSYESPVSKFATYLVEEKDSDTGDEMLMKSIKNEKCIALTLKYLLDQLNTLEHNNLPRIHYQTFSENYSYIVFEKPSSDLVPITTLFPKIKHNETLCKSIIYELCRTIQFTHAFGVVHRDLRPNNIFISIDKHTNKLKKLMLIDFGATKALQSDEKIAIMEGTGFPTSYVRREDGQYPAPEILMDLRYDRQVDAWFVGILIYMILNGGNIPFVGNDDESIQDNILHGSDNKFSVLRSKLINRGSTSEEERNTEIEISQWMDISDDLFDILNGLLTKDAKKRYLIDYILWNDWIPSTNYEHIYKLIIRHWLRIYKLSLFDRDDTVLSVISNFSSIANNIKQSGHRGNIHWHNNDKSVMHQFKLCNYNGTSSYIKSDCYVTISSNIWCKYNDNPITIEYCIDFVKYDCYFGIICHNEYKRDISYYHFIGSDPHSISLSIRYGKAWLNSNDVGDMKRKEYLKQNIPKDNKTRAQKIFNIQQTTEDVENKENEINTERFAGPPPLRNVKVCMRIDSMSRTLSFKINDEILDPLYFEFPGYVSPAFTLCNCMDQVTIKSVKYDDMQNLQDYM